MFAYCGNNPVNRIDPTGHAWWHWAAAAAIVVVAAVAVVATAGGAAAAIAAVASVASGVAASSAAATVAAGVFIGSATALAISAYSAAANSRSAKEFSDYGASALVSTTTGGLYGGAYGYSLTPSPSTQTSACFIAGTLIKAEEGNVPIEEISVGDYVWAWNEETGDVSLKPVVETYINESDELLHIFADGEEIIATPEHPFYSPVKGWTSAAKLRAGDVLVLVNGNYVVVEKIQHELLENPIAVYNFQVAEYHTYYVSHSGLLVHNSCFANNTSGVGKAPKSGAPGSTYTQIASDGTNATVSQTIYNDYGLPAQRTDYMHSHGATEGPHVHIYSYTIREGIIYRNGERIVALYE